MPSTAINALPYPSLTDPPNGPSAFQALAAQLDGRLVPRFATTAARSTAVPSPTKGMLSWIDATSQLEYYSGTAWVLLGPPILFSGFQNVSQSISNNTWTSLTLDSETLDTHAGHSTSSNTSRYVAPVTGIYSARGIVTFGANATGARAARIAVNGSPVLSAVFTATAASTTICVPTFAYVSLTAGQYVEVQGWQTSGGALSTVVTGTDTAPLLNVEWVHA